MMQFHYGNKILLWDIHTYSSMSIHMYTFLKFFIYRISGNMQLKMQNLGNVIFQYSMNNRIAEIMEF